MAVHNEASMASLDAKVQAFNPRVNALQEKILDLETFIKKPDGKLEMFWEKMGELKESF